LFLHHDNAPAHISLVLRGHFAKNSTHIITQPQHSPDFAPCDFWLFSKLKRPLRGTRFESIKEIRKIEEGADGYTGRDYWKNVGTNVFYREGITLKGTKLI